MENIFEKWDKMVDVDGLANDVKELEQNENTVYKDVPHGKYEVSVDRMELGESKKGHAMVKIRFRVVSEGEYKGSCIFYNQVVTQGFQIKKVNEILRKLSEKCIDSSEIMYKNYTQYNGLLEYIKEIITGKYEYALDYKEDKNGYSAYEITEIFTL